MPGRHITTLHQSMCCSFCEECYESENVCEECKSLGQVSHVPSLRFCNYCQGRNTVCFRQVMLVACSDCESGDKFTFEMLQEKLELGSIDPELSVLSVVPDCLHVGKSIKTAFANWWLKCKGILFTGTVNFARHFKEPILSSNMWSWQK